MSPSYRITNIHTHIYTHTHTHTGMKDLFAAVDTGATNAKEASLQLQQKIADNVWGDLIDLNAFGLDGTIEPRAITESRDMVMNGEPKTWDLITQVCFSFVCVCVCVCVVYGRQ